MTDQELVGHLDRYFNEFSRKVDGLREELREEIRQTRVALEEQNRQTRVVVEDLRSDLQMVAEGVMGFGERLEKHENEVLLKFEEVKASIGPYYVDLHRRVGHLEAKADRWDRNVVEVLRERFGKR